MPSDEDLLRQAIDLARAAREHGNQPYGAVLADADGRVLLDAENTALTESDPTGHAETNLVRLAGRQYSPAALGSMTLYASTEPCAMCAAAVYLSGIGTVVYALAASALPELVGPDPDSPPLELSCREVLGRGGRAIEVRGPFPLPEAAAVHQGR